MSVTVGVNYAAISTREKLRGGIVQAKVRRYWPGKAPEWAEKSEEEEEDKYFDALDRALKKCDDLGFSRIDDPRLRRLVQNRTGNRDEQVRADQRRVRHEAEIISTREEDKESKNQETRDEEEEDQEALEETRRRIKEKNLKRTREEADLLPVEEGLGDEEEEEEEEESEYETDSEYEIVLGIAKFEPVFVPKSERDTVRERERLEAKEEALEDLAKMKLETKQIVVEEVKYEEMKKNTLLEDANIGDVETDDEIDQAEEYEAWKTREIDRIKRENDAQEEIDKLRNMTEEESKNPKPSSSSAQPKKKWMFMQRYYHKGAFFQEAGSDGTDDIFQRDYSSPTGEDRFDKSKLRKILQVKKFGHRGRTKWTHLLNEDTTGNVPLREKYKTRMAAMDAPIAKPKGSKRMKDWEY